jgi:hypothetical protein
MKLGGRVMSTQLAIVKQVTKKNPETAPGAVLDYAAFDH